MRAGRWARLIIGLFIVCLLMVASNLQPAYASETLVQANSTNSATSPVSLSYSPTGVSGNLLVVICSSDAAATLTGPSGFTTAINESGDPAQGIFYKVSAGGETSVSCSFSAGGTGDIQILEYSGIENVSPADVIVSAGSTGSSSSGSSGSITTTFASDLLIAALTSDGSSGISAWSNSFTQETSGTSGGKPATRISYASADFAASSTGSFSSAPTVPSGSNWRGQIASFKIAPAVAFSADIVNSSTGTSIASPSVAMSSTTSGFTCQTSTGTMPASGQSIRVTNTNPADKNGWTLTVAVSSSNWSDGAGDSYAFNNSAGSPPGCTSGQLTIVPSTESIAAGSGCTTTGVSPLGSSTAFSGTTPITIASANSSTGYYCYWDVTGVGLSQTIPALQKSGSYSLNLTLTLTAL